MSHRKRKDPDTSPDDTPSLPPLKQPKTEQENNNRPRASQYTLPLETSPKDPSPAFGQPQQLTCFSYTPKRELRFDTSALKYYIPAPINADLGYRYEHWIKRPEERGRIDSLLRAIEQEDVVGERKKGVFVSWRGVMTKLLTAPFETRDPVRLNLMFLDGCIYAEEHTDDAALAEKENIPSRQRRMMYYGYSFESFSTWDEPLQRREQHAERDRVRCWSGDVDTNVQFCSIVKTKIGAERMILGGEVDCCRDRYTGQPNSYVELKTNMIIRSTQDEERFERKLLKFWAQSFLLGIPEVVVGFRTHQGRISTLQTFETLALPRMVRGKPGAWDPKPCLVFAEKLLRFIRSTLVEEKQSDCRTEIPGTRTLSGPVDATKVEETNGVKSSRIDQHDATVWRLEIKPGTHTVTLYKLDPSEVEGVVNGEDRVGFLPTWFWESAVAKL
ncbi:RAI1 like PD-XK nuclease-domain-containing protein [Rhizoctonia solani]|nr:RAI1 like PD-XK nuclease-domain-containing protein [Rhizoctonia solani]